MTVDIAEWVLAAVALAIVVHVIGSALWIGIGPSPSSAAATRLVVSFVPTEARVIHELGAGFGGVALALAKARPAATVVAWEQSLFPALVARWRARGVANLEVRRASFLGADLRDADVVFAYLFRGVMPALAAKLQRELRPNATVITHTFAFRGWVEIEKVVAADAHRTPVWKWRMPSA